MPGSGIDIRFWVSYSLLPHSPEDNALTAYPESSPKGLLLELSQRCIVFADPRPSADLVLSIKPLRN